MSNDEKRYITYDLSDIETKKLMNELPNYFESLGDTKTTAYLNWRFYYNSDKESHFFNMAQGYFEASIKLIENCIANNCDRKSDIWIFPIMFNVIHGIELYLKGFNSLYPIYMDLQKEKEPQGREIKLNHNIQRLCQISVKLLRDSKNAELLDEMLFVEKFINILYKNTEDLTFARYPTNTNKESHFYVNSSKNILIDMNVLRQWVLRLHTILRNVMGYIFNRTENIKEWHDAMQYEMNSELWNLR